MALDALTNLAAAQPGSISFLGSGSGLPLSTLLDQLQANASTGLTLLQGREQGVQAKISAYGKLQSVLAALTTASRAVSQSGAFAQLAASASGSDFSATIGSVAAGSPAATPGTYSITVNSLARAQTLIASGQASDTQALGTGGSISFTLGDGTSRVLDLSGQNLTLSSLASAINGDPSLGLQATLLNDGSATPWRLMLSPTQTGTAAAVTGISVTGNATLASLLDPSTMTQQAATDAQFTINGVAITSASNRVTQAIPGVTLNLQAAGGQPQTLTIAQDSEAAQQAITGFVNAYNAVQATVAGLTAYDAASNTASVLTGDFTARQVQSRLAGVVTFTSTDETSFPNLASLGITLAADGTLSVDQGALSAALAQNPDAVANLFDGPNGLAPFTSGLVDSFTDTGGALQAATESQTSQLASLQHQYDRQSQLVDSMVQTWRQQFAALDAAVAAMNNTSNYLTQQFANLAKSTKGS